MRKYAELATIEAASTIAKTLVSIFLVLSLII
jgi:hypothetical protein